MSNNRETYIYCFLNKTTGAPVYVGKTSVDIENRRQSHISKSNKAKKTPFHEWLNKNKKNYNVILLEKTSFEKSSKSEVRWIKRINKKFPLYNVRHHSFGNPGIGRVNLTEEHISMLGKICDIDLAKIIGCERKTISYQRKIRGIPPRGQDRGASQRKIISLIDIEMIGKHPDYVLAKKIGVSKNFIWSYRQKHKIPSYAETTGNDGKIKQGRPRRKWN